MASRVIDQSGLDVPKPKPHDDGWDYEPQPRITQEGDWQYSTWGCRWIKVVCFGFYMPDNVLYRRPRKGAT